ncbi:hypothetical protein OJF2_14300 [Aquisphaera giovannonii]|uniref:Uncharacterized protein n=1 Tax=Aquisphaera giovannonii TaxID=406548 RepID=A0A5B9VZ47_9BACT|nr:hypothetical protein [Aquisphaera giovannonii]QEH32940.1 hypothetical protein OJF2_14300 [Aquisphaera giovannonii]
MKCLTWKISYGGAAALALALGLGVGDARAQEGTYPVPPTSTQPSAIWYVYPGTNSWSGYAPAGGWAGYVPPTAAPPSATAPTRVYVQPTQPAVGPASPVVTRPYVRYVPAARRSAPATPPAHYREFGTGRNVFLHKPWLPNQ